MGSDRWRARGAAAGPSGHRARAGRAGGRRRLIGRDAATARCVILSSSVCSHLLVSSPQASRWPLLFRTILVRLGMQASMQGMEKRQVLAGPVTLQCNTYEVMPWRPCNMHAIQRVLSACQRAGLRLAERFGERSLSARTAAGRCAGLQPGPGAGPGAPLGLRLSARLDDAGWLLLLPQLRLACSRAQA